MNNKKTLHEQILFDLSQAKRLDTKREPNSENISDLMYYTTRSRYMEMKELRRGGGGHFKRTRSQAE